MSSPKESAKEKPESSPGRAKRARTPRRSKSPFYLYLVLLGLGFALVQLWDSVGFFVFLLFMGASLSYLGDQLGSYCGKKRLSIFGLRPKYTAALVNLVTGLLITLITFAGAISSSEEVRDAIFRVRALKREGRLLANEKAKLATEIEVVQENLVALEEDFEATEARRRKLEKERDSLLESKKSLSQENLTLATQNNTLEEANFDLQKSNLNLEEDRLGLEARRQELNQEIQRKRVEIERLSRTIEKKEIAPVVIPRRQVLMKESSALSLEATTQEIQVVLGKMTEQIRTRVELLNVRLSPESARFIVKKGSDYVAERLRELRLREARRVEKGEIQLDQVPQECHILAYSTRNVSVGERLARIAFEVEANQLLIPKGAEIARSFVDGRLEPGEILDQLLFFDQQVQGVLRDKGVSPTRLRRPQVLPEAGFLLDLAKLVEKLRQSSREHLVVARAGTGLTSYGEIDVVYVLSNPVSPEAPLEAMQEAVDVAVEVAEEHSPDPETTLWDPWSQSQDEPTLKWSELVLPEPVLSAETLLGDAPSEDLLPPELPAPRPETPEFPEPPPQGGNGS